MVPNLGAVVIDLEYDNRVKPGEVMKMKFPKEHRYEGKKKLLP
jgi:hypothetical protein